jgi:hypothetical protein
MKEIFCLFVFLFFSPITFGQSIQAEAEKKTREIDEQDIARMSRVKMKVKTKVSLAEAIKLMEKYIAKEKIDTSKYYLWRVQLTQVSWINGKNTVWHFWWLNEKGGVGDYITIMVSMDKKVWRVPSM